MSAVSPSVSRWLSRGIALAEVSGVLMVLGSLIPGALDPVVALLFGGASSVELSTLQLPARFACGVAGAVLTGWAVSMGLIARRLDTLGPAVIGSAFAWGTVTWFALDALVTIGVGAYFNLIGNAVYFLALFLPAWALRSHGSAERAQAVHG